MGEPRLHYQSDNLTPRRVSVPTSTKPFCVPAETVPALVAKTTEVGVIGNTYLNIFSSAANLRTIRFTGYGNVDNMANGVSVLVRLIPRFTGFNPASKGGMFAFTGVTNNPTLYLRSLADGRLQLVGVNSNFVSMFNLVSVATHSFTSGTAVDVVITWTGTNATNGVKIYIDGVLLVQGTSSANSLFDDAKGQLFGSILAGSAWPQGDISGFDLNEFCIWNEVIDPTASGLNLVGPARTDWVTSTAWDAMPVIPAQDDVRNSVTYGLSSSLTGTLVSPAENQVLDGVGFGASGTEFEGDVILPAAAKVKAPTAFGSGGALTGTLTQPTADQVKDGVQFGEDGNEIEGTVTLPAPAKVADGIEYGAGGNEFTGTNTNPLAGQVKDGVQYGEGGVELEGTLESTDPGEENVLAGVPYLVESVAKEGTLDLPSAGDIRQGVGIGTLVVPPENDVKDGVGFGADGLEFEGTLTVPVPQDVRNGVAYGGGLVGSLLVDGPIKVVIGRRTIKIIENADTESERIVVLISRKRLTIVQGEY